MNDRIKIHLLKLMGGFSGLNGSEMITSQGSKVMVFLSTDRRCCRCLNLFNLNIFCFWEVYTH